MKTARTEHQHILFRLDFALRGHAAYTQPRELDELVALVERAALSLGAPLLLHLAPGK